MATRSPICVVVGHVDHGKSSLLDYIRGTKIVSNEAGGITQAIGASIIPMRSIERVCGPLLKASNITFTIPGLLFIDTPGHAAFTSLRKRGGSLADIAIVAIDINEGLKPQTVEAIQILKESKTPFIIAANKVDLVPGFRDDPKSQVLKLIADQRDTVRTDMDNKLYTLVGALFELGFEAERFDRVGDYTKQIAIIPTSAQSGTGMPEMLMVLSGLAQKFLEQNLSMDASGPAVGTVLEVKEQKGLGTTLDVILTDGTLRPNDTIVIGDLHEPVVAKVRALLQPSKAVDMRDSSAKFSAVKEAVAASGVKVAAPGLDTVIAGMPLRSVGNSTVEEVKAEVMQDVTDVLIETDKDGIILKADTLGSIEALIHLCKANDIPIRKARIGDITKKDVIDAESNFEKDPAHSCILGFNVQETTSSTDRAHIISSKIIYELIDSYKEWKEKLERVLSEKQAESLARPGKLLYMEGCSFRQSNPAVIGVEVLGGKVTKGARLIKQDGSNVGNVKAIQHNKETISSAEKDMQVAVSIDGATIGRQVNERDIYYVDIDEEEFRKLKEHKKQLTPDEIEVLKEFAVIRRENNPVWGI